MFLGFFETLRAHRVPVSLREHLAFLEAMRAGLVIYDVEGFYHLARACLVKDERHIDRFDRAFAQAFEGVERLSLDQVMEAVDLPADWLARMAEKHLSAEERAEIEALGGFDKLMEALRERLAEQQGRHQGGSKWIGTAGTSPFGAHGYNPEGVRIGQDRSRHRRAPSRSGTGASSATSTTPARSAPAPSRWRCAACAAGRARARRRSSTSTARSARPPTTATST